jgi:hypothetical protein
MGVLALTLLFAEGCLVPQSVDPIATRPHTIPRVDLTKLPAYMFQPLVPLDPQGPADGTASPPCQCHLEVDLGVIIADDPAVDIDVRVFVDYDINNTRSQPPITTIHLRGDFNSALPTRRLPKISLDSEHLGGPGVHVVELVLGETAGFADDVVPPPHRAMLSDYESSTFKFVVDVAHVSTRQSCSDSPPPPSEAQVKSCP